MKQLQIAMLNGSHETTAPWYQRAEYPADLGYWHVEGYRVETKLEVVFDAAPESEFLDFRESAKESYPINNWALYVAPSAEGSPAQPLFWGSMCDKVVLINKCMVVSFHARIDMTAMSVQARYAALHLMFGMPKRQGHDKALASILADVSRTLSDSPAWHVDGAGRFDKLMS